MDYKDNELEQMMSAIKNLKKNSNEEVKNENISTINKDPLKSKEENKKTEEKDTSFYSRFFHHNTNKQTNQSSEEINNLFQQYVNSQEFMEKIDNIVQKVILSSVRNNHYMSLLIETIIKEHTNINKEMEGKIQESINSGVSNVIKKCTDGIINTLKN